MMTVMVRQAKSFKLGYSRLHKQSFYWWNLAVYCSACFASIPFAALKTKWHSFEMRWFFSPSADILGDTVSFLAAVIFRPWLFWWKYFGFRHDAWHVSAADYWFEWRYPVIPCYNITMKAVRPAGLLLTRRQISQSINSSTTNVNAISRQL